MNDLGEILESVLTGVRTPPSVIDFLPVLPITRRRFRELIDRCVDAQKKLKATEKDSDDYFELQKIVYEIESDYRSTRTKLLLFPAFTGLYFGAACLVYIFAAWDIPNFIQNTLGVEAPEKLVTLGVAGAFLYLATSLLSSMESHEGTQGIAALRFTIRLTLAIVVPIILVALFFNSNGELMEVTLSPELLSFACGYSAKLVVDIFNKIVEKGSKMVEAI